MWYYQVFDNVTCSLNTAIYTFIYLVILPLNYIVIFGGQEATFFFFIPKV